MNRRTGGARLYHRYPPDQYRSQMLPTTIGNVLLSGERYGLDRYGFDSTVLWPRFYWCLPEPVQQSMERFKEEHQLPIALSFVSFLFAVASGVTVYGGDGSATLFAVTTGAGLGLAVGAYLLAIERTEEYAEQIRATVDLHHQKLESVWTRGGGSEQEWLATVTEFVLAGPDALTARAEEAARASAATAAAATNPVTATNPATTAPGEGADPANLTIVTKAGSEPGKYSCVTRPRMEQVVRIVTAVTGRVRALWLVTAIAAVTITVGTVSLKDDTVTVLRAVQRTAPGEPIEVVELSVDRDDAPADRIDPSTDTPLMARVPIGEGDTVTTGDTYLAADTVTFTLPTSSTGPTAGELVTAVIGPCGAVIDRAFITDIGTSDVTLLVPRSALSALDECDVNAVTLLRDAERLDG
jgi:hypothetical protein